MTDASNEEIMARALFDFDERATDKDLRDKLWLECSSEFRDEYNKDARTFILAALQDAGKAIVDRQFALNTIDQVEADFQSMIAGVPWSPSAHGMRWLSKLRAMLSQAEKGDAT